VGNLNKAYELALKQREFEITQLTNRNNFFMIFQGVLIAGLIQSHGKAFPIINFMVCLIGLLMSGYQACMAGGAKYWQIRWETAVKELEIKLLEAFKDEPFVMQLFTSDKKHLSEDEIARLDEVNKTPARKKDPLKFEEGFIDNLVKTDLRELSDCSLAKTIITKRYSVSKIPIYVGVALALFWGILWINTFSLGGLNFVKFPS